MVYNKHDWQDGELIVPDTLNHLESGLDNASTEVNVKGYGAVGDGNTDDTVAILQAYSIAVNQNTTVYVPYGKYMVNFDNIPDKKLFRGSGVIVNNGKQFNISTTPNRNGLDKLQNPTAITKYTYGRYNTATGLSVSANTEDEAAVIGINDNSNGLENYGNRDSVAIYATNTSTAWKIDTTGVTFGSNYVDVPDDVDLSLVRVGMFIDTTENPKNTGIITGVVGNRITVNKWITMGGDGSSAIPTNNSEIIINPTTSIWGQNTVVQLNPDTPIMSAVGYEMDIINYQPHRTDVDGITVISVGSYPANAAFTARKVQSGQWYYSLLSKDSEYGLHHTGGSVGVFVDTPKTTALSIKDAPVTLGSVGVKTNTLIKTVDQSNNELFHIMNDGTLSKLIPERQAASGNVSKPIVFATGDITLDDTNKHWNEVIILTNTTANNITVTAPIMYQGTKRTSIAMKPYMSAMFVCDGLSYYNTNFTSPFV